MPDLIDKHTWVHGTDIKRVRIGGEPRFKRIDTCSECGCKRTMHRNPDNALYVFTRTGYAKDGKYFPGDRMPGCKDDSGNEPFREQWLQRKKKKTVNVPRVDQTQVSEKILAYRQFIQAHAEHFTAADFAYELGISVSHVSKLAACMRIKLLSRGRQVDQYLLGYGPKKTVAQLAKALKLEEHYIRRRCREVGITPLAALDVVKPAEPERPRWISPREVFSKTSFKMPY
jgi:AraC-like DNA-binding protein